MLYVDKCLNAVIIICVFTIMCTNTVNAKNSLGSQVEDSKPDRQCSIVVYGIKSTVEMIIEISNEVFLTQKIKDYLQNNDLSGFTFQESEKVLCYYLGTAHDFSDMYVFTVCKEELNGDIVHERDIYIARETGHIYVKDNGSLVQMEVDVPKGMQLPDVTRNSAWNWEPELVYSENGTTFHITCGEEGAKVLEQMIVFLEQEKVLEDLGVMYCGECTYYYKRYHEVHLVELSDTHTHIRKRYYIDALNGNVYEEPEDWYMDSRIALHFVGNIEIGEEDTIEAD